MHARSPLCAVLLATVLLALSAPLAAAEPDLPGSRDPHRIERFPRSWIVAYERDDELRPRELVTSRVDRIRRDLRIDDLVQVDATREVATYRIPEGTSVAEVYDHYLSELGGDLLYRCESRSCGRSADWAHQVFSQTLLYGPDANQRYAALEWQGLLVSLYVNERGNKRVYAHLTVLDPEGARTLEPNLLLVQRLTERGWAVLEGVSPGTDGRFDAESLSRLAEAGGRLAGFATDQLYLVCHLGGAVVPDLLTTSQSCAERAIRQLVQGADRAEGGDGPSLVPFGAGPLLPRRGAPRSRLELIVPGADRTTR